MMSGEPRESQAATDRDTANRPVADAAAAPSAAGLTELTTWRGAFDPQAPVIVIGAGRSGTTLLTRMLHAHPSVDMKGETNFLTHKLWETLWTDGFWHQWRDFVATRPTSSSDPKPQQRPGPEADGEGARIALLIATMLPTLLGVEPKALVWGFKEVWNGSSVHDYCWDSYDRVFPRALWLHVVRHPLDFARSCAAWDGRELTTRYMRQRLGDWVSIVQRARQRKRTGSFHELRFEDMVQSPRQALEPIIQSLGLQWSDQCSSALSQRVLESRPQSAPGMVELSEILAQLPAIVSTARSLDYQL